MNRHVRGVLFVDYVKMLRRERAVERAARYLQPEDARFLTERLELDGWYPMATFERLGLAILHEIVGLETDAIRLWGRGQIATLLTFLPDLAAAGDPRDAVIRLQNFMLSLFTFPALTVESVDDESASIAVSYGMSPEAELAATWQTIGFFEELVHSSGGQRVQCSLVGSTFTLQWKLGQAQPTMLAHPRVLLVDDERLVLAALERSLQSTAVITIAQTMKEAVELLERCVFDTVVADHFMGNEGTGVDLLMQVSQRWPHIRRILHSGNPPPVDTLLSLQVIHEVLTKPAPIDLLRRAISTPTAH